jgi:hypothetical protein
MAAADVEAIQAIINAARIVTIDALLFTVVLLTQQSPDHQAVRLFFEPMF